MQPSRCASRFVFLFLVLVAVAPAQVCITAGQTRANPKIPVSRTVTPGALTASSFEFGGGHFLTGLSMRVAIEVK
jgi:hypothetical protein